MPELSAVIEAPDPSSRRRALASIPCVPAGPADVADFLFELLGDDDPSVRHAVVELVGRSAKGPGLEAGGPLALALSHAIRDESLARRSTAVDAYGRLGARAVGWLAPLLAEPQDGLRRLAVDALGLTGDPAAAPALIAALDDASAAVRAAAIEALCRAEPLAADRQIRTLLRRKDEPASVRLSALLSLESLGSVPDPGELRPHVKDPMTAVPALRLLGRAGAANDLVEALMTTRGPRLRAALAGLTVAFSVDKGAVARAVNSRTLITDEVEKMLTGPDPLAAEGALVVGALLGHARWFADVASRVDRSRLLTAAHAAARELRDANAAAHLHRLADAAQDSAAAAFLTELAQGLDATAPPPPPRIATRPRLDEDSFKRLAALYLREAGLHFDSSAAYRLESRLQLRLEATGLRDFKSYVDLLEGRSASSVRELSASLERVTVHETYFFREAGQLDAFRQAVVPILATEAPRRQVRIWSAGCSTGEEVWTLAMILDEAGAFASGTYALVGSDVAPGVIETARAGVYGQRGFRGEMTGRMRDRYFDEVERGFRIKDSLRKNVTFHAQNLLKAADTERIGIFDVIFCRNVLIYFSRAARAALIQRFFDLLAPGGILFLGHSESLLNLETPFAFAPIARELVYVRASEDGRARLGDHLLRGAHKP